MNPNEHGPTLTIAEGIRLAQWLAERGHQQAAHSVVVSVAIAITDVALAEHQARLAEETS